MTPPIPIPRSSNKDSDDVGENDTVFTPQFYEGSMENDEQTELGSNKSVGLI